VSTYNVTYRRDGGAWLVRVTDDERLHTYGRTIGRARQAIREVIALWHDDEAPELVETFELGGVEEIVGCALRARRVAAEAVELADARIRRAVKELREHGVSVRDSAAILDLSPARIDQLAR
jgi:predicted RNase H-like HicB family nuclease